jgi:hypothetical protein
MNLTLARTLFVSAALLLVLPAANALASASRGQEGPVVPRPSGEIYGVVPAAPPGLGHAPRSTDFAGTKFTSTANMTYHGGPVQRTNQTFAIYWVPSGFTISSGYRSLIDGFLGNVAAASGATSNVYASDTQYSDTTGPIAYSSAFAGSYLDTQALPANGCSDAYTSVCLSDSQLQTEIARVVSVAGWHPGPNSLVLMMTAKGVGSCVGSSCAFSYYCAYHSSMSSGGASYAYANMPYADTVAGACDSGQHPNADDADATINVLSHEHNETITDPLGNAWFDSGGAENGDKCAWNFGSALGGSSGSLYNQVINGAHYWLQMEWSNASSSCVQTYSATAPSISSFSPASGPVGTSVTINGSGFTGATSVKFNGTTASFSVASGTQITATVPSGATTGPISVASSAGTATSSSSFTVTVGAPSISSFSPTSGPVGTSVTINGSGFTGATSVKFNGTTASFSVNSATRITATVPAGATTGTISVTTAGGTATSPSAFSVTNGLRITTFSPLGGPVGTVVTINGSGFTGATAVAFGGVAATSFIVASDSQITATVPSGARSGPISVTTPGGTATSSSSFRVRSH